MISRRVVVFAILLTAVATGLVAMLLVTIVRHKQEEKSPYLRLVKVTDQTTDPAP